MLCSSMCIENTDTVPNVRTIHSVKIQRRPSLAIPYRCPKRHTNTMGITSCRIWLWRQIKKGEISTQEDALERLSTVGETIPHDDKMTYQNFIWHLSTLSSSSTRNQIQSTSSASNTSRWTNCMPPRIRECKLSPHTRWTLEYIISTIKHVGQSPGCPQTLSSNPEKLVLVNLSILLLRHCAQVSTLREKPDNALNKSHEAPPLPGNVAVNVSV